MDLIGSVHRATKRNYVERVVQHDKAHCAEVATQFGKDYWDGERQYGYGGYRYDGRWRAVAEAMVKHYGLEPDASILDVGCAKGFLLYEFTRVLPRATVRGIDVSGYAIEHAKPEVRPFLGIGSATDLPFPDASFDLVLSINVLHNLKNHELHRALREMQRVGKRHRYFNVESYRNEREKANLLYWQLTCRTFAMPDEWEWTMQQAGYTGDHGFIFFE